MARLTQREDQANASQRRLVRLAESAPVGAGSTPVAGSSSGTVLDVLGTVPDAVDDPADTAVDGPVGAGAGSRPGAAAKPIKVGWRVRRWLPQGTTEVRIDPGRRAAVVLAVVAVLGAAVAGFGVWRSRPVAEPVPATLPAASDGSPAPTTAELVVSVAGLVARPGLVRLPAGARVADAVAAAGGPMPGTDLAGLNLARRLTDGEHVMVGAPAAPAAAGPAGQNTPPSNGARVDLNTATLAELDALPGIGPVTAQRILDWRAEHGRFTTIDQLREIEGIGETRFARLRDLVTA